MTLHPNFSVLTNSDYCSCHYHFHGLKPENILIHRSETKCPCEWTLEIDNFSISHFSQQSGIIKGINVRSIVVEVQANMLS